MGGGLPAGSERGNVGPKGPTKHQTGVCGLVGVGGCAVMSLSPGLYLGPSFFPSLFSLSLSLSVWGVEERESGLASQSGVRGEGGGDDVRCVVLLCVCVCLLGAA